MIFVFAVVKIKRVCECKRFFISLIHISLVYFLEQLRKLYQKTVLRFSSKRNTMNFGLMLSSVSLCLEHMLKNSPSFFIYSLNAFLRLWQPLQKLCSPQSQT